MSSSSDLIEIVYSSFSVTAQGEDDLRSILLKARTNNAQKSITGCLIYKNREFIQLLEGPEKEVRELYAKIALDPRHTRCRVVHESTIPSRSFEKWSMLYVLMVDGQWKLSQPIEQNESEKVIHIEDGQFNAGREIFQSICSAMLS